jgi:serine/threonine protein kinase
MKAIHTITSDGSKFILEPLSDIEKLLSQPAILTIYHDLTLRYYMDHKLQGDNDRIRRLATGLCKGICHMHQCGYAHRDIKIDNILIQNLEGDPIIIDLGLANAKSRRAGTPKYTAPEQSGRKGAHTGNEWWILEGWDQRLFDSWAIGTVIK